MRLFDKLHQTLPGVESATPRTWSEHVTTTLPSKISRERSQILVQCSRTHFCDSSNNHRQTQLNDLGYKTITRVSIVVDVTIDMHARSSALPPLRWSRADRLASFIAEGPRPGGIPPQQTLTRVIIQVSTHSQQNTRSKNILIFEQLKQRGLTDFPVGLSFIVELRLVEDE